MGTGKRAMVINWEAEIVNHISCQLQLGALARFVGQDFISKLAPRADSGT